MAVDPSDLTSTPEGYASPDQVKQAYALANLLSQHAMNSGLIRSPWQGLSNITNAVMGGLASRQADLRAQQAQAGVQKTIADIYARQGGAVPGAAPAAPAAPSNQGQTTNWNPAWGSPSPAPAAGPGASPWKVSDLNGILAPPVLADPYSVG
jgi:hypothetical protein